MYEEQAKEFAKKVYEERKKKVEEEEKKKESEIFQHVMNIMEMFSYSTKEETMVREIDLVPKVENKGFLEISVKGEDGDFLNSKEIPKEIKEAIGKTKIPKELRLEICEYFRKNLSDYFIIDVVLGVVQIYLKKDITICEKEEAEE